mmetsp:Transcript_17904/g.39325  ORF Transcript_17904/g.39325 Transcript_17904/m.39325 type:complete len:220 (+) Transcript_17904:255-914(+)
MDIGPGPSIVRIRHPMEEERMVGLDAVFSLRLLDSEPEIWPLVIRHEPHPGMSLGVVCLAASEIRLLVGRTAIHSDSPEVIRCQGLLSIDNRRHAVHVAVPECHRLVHVQTGGVREENAARIYHLLTASVLDINCRIEVEVGTVEEVFHVRIEDKLAHHASYKPANERREEDEDVPGRLSRLARHFLTAMESQRAKDQHHQKTQPYDEVAKPGLLVVHL